MLLGQKDCEPEDMRGSHCLEFLCGHGLLAGRFFLFLFGIPAKDTQMVDSSLAVTARSLAHMSGPVCS